MIAFEWKRIEDIVDNIDSRRKPLNEKERKEITVEGKYPYCGANGIVDYVDEYIFDKEILCIAEDGSDWSFNKKCSYIMNEKCWVNNHAHVVTAKSGIILKYLSYYLNYADLSSKITGTTRGKLTKSALNSIEVPIPSYKIQQSIVQILDKNKEIIEKRNEQIQICDELIKSQFIEMFGSVKDNKFGYKIVRLGDYAKLQGGYAFKSKDFVEEGTKLVQISNVNKDTLDWETINCLPEEYLDKYNGFSLKVGDIVLAMTRPVIKSLDAVKIAYVGEKDVPSLLNQRVGRFVVNNECIDSAYLMECCRTRDFREYVERMSGNSLQPNVSSKQVEEYSILLPPLELQNQFAQFVQQVDKLKFEMEQSLVELENNFNSLMQRAFKGELF